LARIAVFWNHQPGYLRAGLVELISQGHQVHLATIGGPRDPAIDSDGITHHSLATVNPDAIQPDLALFCGWHIREINEVHQRTSSAIPRLLYFDTQWRGNTRQRLRLPVARRRLPRAYSHAFIPSLGQAELARRIGFSEQKILWGALTFDERTYAPSDHPTTTPGFIFAGRLVDVKGIDILLPAYHAYRAVVNDPGPLLIAGQGPLQSLVDPAPAGVRWLGHLEPADLNAAMVQCTTFVLPSRFEPYGVVVQEAAASGLSIIATTECGSSADMVRPGFNGFLVTPGSISELATALVQVHELAADVRVEMGRNSHYLSKVVSPSRWCSSLLSALAN